MDAPETFIVVLNTISILIFCFTKMIIPDAKGDYLTKIVLISCILGALVSMFRGYYWGMGSFLILFYQVLAFYPAETEKPPFS